MKALLLILTMTLVSVANAVPRQEIQTTIRLKDVMEITTKAVQKHYSSEYGLNLAPTSIQQHTLELITIDGRIEISVATPSREASREIPYYCVVELQRKRLTNTFEVQHTYCDTWD